MAEVSEELEPQNDLHMYFEDFVEDDDAGGGDARDESLDEDEDGSWEDIDSTSDDGGEIGEEGVVDAVEVPPAAGAGGAGVRRVPQPYLHEPMPMARDGVVPNHGDAYRQDVEPLRLLNNDW